MHFPARLSSLPRMPGLAAGLAVALTTGAAAATPVTLNDPYQWLENRSTNTVGRTPGLLQNFGVSSVVPNGLAGTTATATQGSTVLNLPFTGTTAISNEFNRVIAADPTTYGAWRLDFSNGADRATAFTPAIDPTLAPMPFVTDVRLTNTTSTSFSWAIPAAASVDAVRVNLYDHGRLNLAGSATDIVYNATFARGTTSFTVPTTLANGLPLVNGNLYTLEIALLDFASNAQTGSQNDLRNRSRLYVDFLPGTTPPTGTYLPVVQPGIGGATPLFRFDISAVGPALVYIDPVIAAGYAYKTGQGNPNFQSVLLPQNIGDGLYRIRLADGQVFDATGGTPFSFAAGGVSSFDVLGIEPSAGLNASDPTAFLTGLTFTEAGRFTGTMQAIPVPEPATSLMALAGLAGLAVAVAVRRRRVPVRA